MLHKISQALQPQLQATAVVAPTLVRGCFPHGTPHTNMAKKSHQLVSPMELRINLWTAGAVPVFVVYQYSSQIQSSSISSIPSWGKWNSDDFWIKPEMTSMLETSSSQPRTMRRTKRDASREGWCARCTL